MMGGFGGMVDMGTSVVGQRMVEVPQMMVQR
jgi:hypothetical protein